MSSKYVILKVLYRYIFKTFIILQSLGAPKFVSRKDLFDETYGLLNQVSFYMFLQRVFIP